jgi:hypothetical protein
MINHQNRLYHPVDMVFVAASFEAFVEDMLQDKRHNVNFIKLITRKFDGLKIKIDYYYY